MECVNVLNKGTSNYPQIDSYKKSTSCLYNFEWIIGKKELDIEKMRESVTQLRNTSIKNKTLYVDSAGYAILKGNVKPDDIEKYIDRYLKCIEHGSDLFDYIFTLDCPFSKKYTELNKVETIYSLNKKVLTDIMKIAENNPDLIDKLYYVTHFKTLNLYKVWQRQELDTGINKIIKNRAIGGLVGLRSASRKIFSPFIASAYKCLHDYLEAGNFESDFRLHFLGVYLPHDRFIIALLEKLFQRYLSDIAGAVHTYDTYSFELIAIKGYKRKYKIYNLNKNNMLTEYSDITKVPRSVIDKIYSHNSIIHDEIQKMKSGKRWVLSNALVPMNIYSNRCLDRFFEYIIDKHDMCNTSSSKDIRFNFESILSNYGKYYPDLFTKNFIDNIGNSLDIILEFDDWFKNNGDYKALDILMFNFIKRIGINEILI